MNQPAAFILSSFIQLAGWLQKIDRLIPIVCSIFRQHPTPAKSIRNSGWGVQQIHTIPNCTNYQSQPGICFRKNKKRPAFGSIHAVIQYRHYSMELFTANSNLQIACGHCILTTCLWCIITRNCRRS